MLNKKASCFKLKNNRLNNRDFNIEQNIRNNFFRNRAALDGGSKIQRDANVK